MESLESSKEKILNEIYDSYVAYHTLPHLAMVPDWFLRYWDLAEMIYEAYGLEMTQKPTLTKPEEFEALKAKIVKSDNTD